MNYISKQIQEKLKESNIKPSTSSTYLSSIMTTLKEFHQYFYEVESIDELKDLDIQEEIIELMMRITSNPNTLYNKCIGFIKVLKLFNIDSDNFTTAAQVCRENRDNNNKNRYNSNERVLDFPSDNEIDQCIAQHISNAENNVDNRYEFAMFALLCYLYGKLPPVRLEYRHFLKNKPDNPKDIDCWWDSSRKILHKGLNYKTSFKYGEQERKVNDDLAALIDFVSELSPCKYVFSDKNRPLRSDEFSRMISRAFKDTGKNITSRTMRNRWSSYKFQSVGHKDMLKEDLNWIGHSLETSLTVYSRELEK